ncbi:hypothetical protein [Saccharopolyspora sp. 6V]|uniref:hypothetical protein n=1 Tax=Saccharopolyspora sp. 6V TaxID=2877239 RepID=UPI001CD26CC2|nr:hypothetical protein [Saccharopolyspora sp. 6V]MCA1191652.1 hypothetical protein [Saccharopolyspora sp. 6V]
MTQQSVWDRPLKEPYVPPELKHLPPRTVLQMVEDVMAHRTTRSWSAPELLTSKEVWTATEVVELVVELWDGDDEDGY